MRDIQHHLASTLRLSRVWQHVSAGGVLFPVVYHGRDSGRWSASVHRVASRSAHIAVGAGHGRLSSTWLKYLGPGPGEGASLKGGSCAPVPAQHRGVKDVLIVEGAPPAPERSARGNATGSPAFPRRTQAVLAPRPRSPPAQVPPGSAPLDAVRLLRRPQEGRRRSQGRSAPPRTRRPPGRL